MKGFVVLLALFNAFFISAAEATSELYEVREIHYQMGTFLDLTIWHPQREAGKKILRRLVQVAHRLEGALSHYDSESSVSQLNRRAGQGRVKIDPELFQILSLSVDFASRTQGYFDVTVGPLMDLWAEAEKKGRAPSAADLERIVRLVGSRNLKLYRTGEAELALPGMRIDLGGIGKGYAVDQMVKIVQEAHVTAALINFGGSSIYGLGSPPGQEGWEIWVKEEDGRLIHRLHLRDQALSTSASMGHYWSIDGQKYGHMVNPRDGLPLREPRMATVVCESATIAEALTKPLVLLGKKGMELIKDFPGAEALLMSKGREFRSEGFPD